MQSANYSDLMMKDLALQRSEQLYKVGCDAMDKNEMYYYRPNWIK